MTPPTYDRFGVVDRWTLKNETETNNQGYSLGSWAPGFELMNFW